MSNLLFDKYYNLVGIVDWEWSRVVPVQFMVPPIWLNASQLEFVLLIQEDYNKQVGYLRAAIQEHEKALGLPPRLSTEWAPLEKWYVLLFFFPKPLKFHVAVADTWCKGVMAPSPWDSIIPSLPI